MRRVNFFARREFDFADFKHVLRALVEELHDLRVELVNGLAMVRDVHAKAGCRIKNQESNLFRDWIKP